jgi:hypothetical protein
MVTRGTDHYIKMFMSFCTLPLVAAVFLLCAAPFAGADLAAAPAGAIDKEIVSAKSFISQGKLQDARDALSRAQQSMADLSGATASGYGAKIQKLSAAIAAKEDSLVNVNLEILRHDGADAAFQYMQEVVWAYGVSREKMDLIENTILNEAPAVNAAQERDDMARAVQLLEANKPMDPSIDPYIVKTAQMMLQARADSIQKAQAAAVSEQTAMAPVTTPEEAIEPKPSLAVEPEPAMPISEPEIEQPAKPSEAAVPVPVETNIGQPTAYGTEQPQQVAAVIVPQPRKSLPSDRPKKPEEYTSPALLARAEATKEYLKKLKVNQLAAQNKVVEMYNLIENGQGRQAMQMFRNQREFISKYLSPQVFNVLELTLAQTIIDAQNEAAAASRPTSPSTPEEQITKKIDGLLRQNKVEAAYKEFSREESTLKKSMPKIDFKLLKDMVEEAYKLRTGIDVKSKNKK